MALEPSTFSYLSPSGHTSWIDQEVCSSSFSSTVMPIPERYDIFGSDHFHLLFELSCAICAADTLCADPPPSCPPAVDCERVSASQLVAYGVGVERRILALDITTIYHCTLPYCTNPSHTSRLEGLYYTLISILNVSACHTLPLRPGSTNRKRVGLNVISGWNTHVRPHYVATTNALLLWVTNGRPLGDGLDFARRILHRRFRSALRWCKRNMVFENFGSSQ